MSTTGHSSSTQVFDLTTLAVHLPDLESPVDDFEQSTIQVDLADRALNIITRYIMWPDTPIGLLMMQHCAVHQYQAQDVVFRLGLRVLHPEDTPASVEVLSAGGFVTVRPVTDVLPSFPEESRWLHQTDASMPDC